MLVTIGAASVVIGSSAAVVAGWYPAQRSRLERWGGGLFLGGLVLIGFTLPML